MKKRKILKNNQKRIEMIGELSNLKNSLEEMRQLNRRLMSEYYENRRLRQENEKLAFENAQLRMMLNGKYGNNENKTSTV